MGLCLVTPGNSGGHEACPKLDKRAASVSPIRLVRSWPKTPFEGNPRADDKITRLYNDDYDYAGLADLGASVIHLDWDIAVSLEDLQHFARHARRAPEKCLVGPYKLYPGGLNRGTPRDHEGAVYAAYRYADDMTCRFNVTPDDKTCDQFGFGMVYLPAWAITGYVKDCPGILFDDIGFSSWYQAQAGSSALCWTVRPVHMNYPAPTEL